MRASVPNVHKNHRSRLREKVADAGGILRDHELLEVYLYGAIPMKDTNPIAHELLGLYGSLQGVVEAPIEGLAAVRNMTYNAAVSLKLLGELHSRLSCPRIAVQNGADAVASLATYFKGLETERLVVLGLNATRHVVLTKVFSNEDAESVEIRPQKVFRAVVTSDAKGVILAHNHPNGRAYPSEQDRTTTERMRRTLADAGIRLIDHYIFADNAVFSIYNDCIIAKDDE